MENNLINKLSQFCKCTHCQKNMTCVVIIRNNRYCVNCVRDNYEANPDMWSGGKKSAIWTRLCHIYNEYEDSSSINEGVSNAEKLKEIQQIIQFIDTN